MYYVYMHAKDSENLQEHILLWLCFKEQNASLFHKLRWTFMARGMGRGGGGGRRGECQDYIVSSTERQIDVCIFNSQVINLRNSPWPGLSELLSFY